MAQTRKVVREAALYCLSAAGTGFNDRMAAIAGDYGIEPVTIDWSQGSASFIQVAADASGVDISTQINADAAINLWTGDLANDGAEVGVLFTETMDLHVDIYLKFKVGAERDDIIERTADAFEDAAKTCLWANASGIHTRGVSPDKQYRVQKPSATLYGDGWSQVIPIQIRVGVKAV